MVRRLKKKTKPSSTHSIEREYEDVIIVTDPMTGEKREQRVKVTRYKINTKPNAGDDTDSDDNEVVESLNKIKKARTEEEQ